MDRWATFDCYGTLIDWERGIGDTIAHLWPDADRQKLLARFHEIEPEVQAGPYRPYREVLARTLETLSQQEGLDLRPLEVEALADSLPTWPPFPEVRAAMDELLARRWRWAILSNVDPDLLSESIIQLGVQPDITITAHDAGWYKPIHAHWVVFRQRTNAEPSRHVHVAASLFHDIAPAAQLEIPAVWINRLDEKSDLPRAAELPDLSSLPDVLGQIVPDE